MRSWSVVENFSLNCLLISIDFYFREEYMDRVRRRQAGWKSDVEDVDKFLFFLFFFVNRLYSFLPSSLLNARLHFHVIHPHLIIQHKVSFSSRSISFFLFFKNKKIKNYAISHLTFCCVYGYPT